MHRLLVHVASRGRYSPVFGWYGTSCGIYDTFRGRNARPRRCVRGGGGVRIQDTILVTEGEARVLPRVGYDERLLD